MSDKKTELQEYFNTLARKPIINQIQMKALIDRGLEANEQSRLVRDLVTKGDRGVVIESTLELGSDQVLVLKSMEFKDGRCFAVDTVNLQSKELRPTCEYHNTKEEAIIAGLIKNLGGGDTVISALQLMIKGSN